MGSRASFDATDFWEIQTYLKSHNHGKDLLTFINSFDKIIYLSNAVEGELSMETSRNQQEIHPLKWKIQWNSEQWAFEYANNEMILSRSMPSLSNSSFAYKTQQLPMIPIRIQLHEHIKAITICENTSWIMPLGSYSARNPNISATSMENLLISLETWSDEMIRC